MREHTPLFRCSGHSTERSAEQTVIPSANANNLAACALPLLFTRSEFKQPESFGLEINPFRASPRPCWESRLNPSAPRPMGNCFGKEQYPERKHSYFFGAPRSKLYTIGWSRSGLHDERTSVLLQLPGGLRPSIGTTVVHLRWKEDRAVIVSNNAAMRRECARANDERPPVPSYNDDDDDWDMSHPILARVGSSIASFPSRNL
ncbi:hypothetical protein EDB92DRAFT_1815188 [Lactarius akahatsu]|uniref:Uncharacterized protein n=1 Tax=Lactarius akahatsu TaxID=416441 RepID=A0AAD4LP98_9AGAM|nr:hypothetical protein EDB92DRAFT_1815188 [Lactarius akahatsu]